MRVTKIEIESCDKEYLVFTSSRPAGMPSEFGPIVHAQRYVIKTEDAMKVLRFLNLSDFGNSRAEAKDDADAD